MEIVTAISSRKLASIDVIGMEEFPFEAVLGKAVGAALKKVIKICQHHQTLSDEVQFHEGKGVKFHMSSKVDKIIAQEGNPNLAGGVVVNGETLPCDFIIMGVGVAPATQYLKDSGIQIEKDGGIKVDKYLRVKTGADTKNVFAIGKTFQLFSNSFHG